MRIAVDARELAGRPTGVGRYLAEILAAWNDLADAAAHEFVLCAPAPVAPARTDALRVTAASAPGRGTLWEQLVLPRLAESARADVLFAPAYTAPLRGRIPVALTVHDVSFAARPEWFSWREGTRRRLVTKLSARRACRVITVSQFSKAEIVRHLGVAPDRIDVIYSGVTQLARRRTPECLVLYVGSLFNRRHLPALVEGFLRLLRDRPDARLEIVGDNRTRPYVDVAGLAAAARDRIRIRDYVPDDELADLYGRASAFAFLSEYEGFGMTPLDALAAGIPVVVLDTPVAREIYGPAAIYVSTPDPALVSAALARALYDEQERARVLEAAPRQLARYSWQECARRTLEVLVACGGGR